MLELILFIVIVSVTLAGVAAVMGLTAQRSADPQVQRQALAIAESLLEEIEGLPFTWCDPDDPLVATVTALTGCTTLPEALGPESGESRFGSLRFDHVSDFHGYVMNGVTDLAGALIPELSAYTARVSVAPASLGTLTAASGDLLRITVQVSGPGGISLSLEGYRSRHAPNTAL
ncbi:type IV pilus modification PilV family protein [Ideonella livida]|uniref:Type II secretion system protein n=1 Tax=Ideonella livida TaxID=2707176 RepID=A0A7C9TIZ7_9BURK|nr:type II secretion system protein [Ideonella livida]NDY89867.1 type II secretion system protein [Ideonella livida]